MLFRIFQRYFGVLTRMMDVLTLPAWSDNYMYLVVDKKSKVCAAVDPIEPDKILATVKQQGLQLSAILTTHHHEDHASGNESLVKKWKELCGKELVVYGGDERIPAVTKRVSQGDQHKIGDMLLLSCFATPCHTSGHICFHVTEDGTNNPGVVFTGDTLFLGGCGRFFEGNAEQMYKALVGSLAKLHSSTKVYCGHEYTVKNLEFALTVEPKNEALKQRLNAMQKLRAAGQPTVPGTIAEELATNPFMRVEETSVLTHANTHDPVEAMRVIRKEKDSF